MKLLHFVAHGENAFNESARFCDLLHLYYPESRRLKSLTRIIRPQNQRSGKT